MTIQQPVVPYALQRGKYKPVVGHVITLTIPDAEVLRATIKGVVNENAIVVEINSTTVAKHHGYKKGDVVPAKREIGDHGIEIWQVVSDRELEQQERLARFERDQREIAERQAAEEAEARRKADIAAAEAAGTPGLALVPRGTKKSTPHKRLGARRSKITKRKD